MVLKDDYLEAGVVSRFGSLGFDGIQGPRVESFALARERLSARFIPEGPLLFNVDASDVIRGHSDLLQNPVFDLIWDVIAATRQLPR